MTDQSLGTVDGRLPKLIDRARGRLAEARTSAEVLESHQLAKFAAHLARVTNAANETQADCLRIIVRAEMRMAREIDAAQDRGEIARQETGVRTSDTSTLDEIGVDRRRVAEWRDAAEAGDEVVEGAIRTVVASGKAPRQSHVRDAVKKYLDRKKTNPTPPEEVSRLCIWLRTGAMLCEAFGSGEEAVAECHRHGIRLDSLDIDILQSFADGLISSAKAVRAARSP